MIARARVLVDAVFDADDALARGELARTPRLDAALPLELALALRNDDLEAVELRGERFVERRAHGGDVVAVDDTQPAHADAAQRVLDDLVVVHARFALVGGAGL